RPLTRLGSPSPTPTTQAFRYHGSPAHLRATHSTVSSVRNAASVHHSSQRLYSVRRVRVTHFPTSSPARCPASSAAKPPPPLLDASSSSSGQLVARSTISPPSGWVTVN